MKTIKEVSKAFGVSTVTVYKWLKNADVKAHVSKHGGAMVIDEQGLNIIRARYGDKSIVRIASHDDESTALTPSKDYIALLTAQLKEKDEQIGHLMELLANAQRLQVTQLLTDTNRAMPQVQEKPSLISVILGSFLWLKNGGNFMEFSIAPAPKKFCPPLSH